jgi:hypothetical protein
MRERTAVALATLVLIAVVIVAGCTTNKTTNTSSSINNTSTNQGQSRFLSAFVNAYHDDIVQKAAEQNMTLQTWTPHWAGGLVKIQYELSNSSLHSSYNTTLLQFKTVDDASAFIKNKSATYALLDTEYENGSAYERVAGHKPTTYVEYKLSGSSTSTENVTYNLVQIDNMVVFGDRIDTQ